MPYSNIHICTQSSRLKYHVIRVVVILAACIIPAFTGKLSAEEIAGTEWEYYYEKGMKQFNARMYDEALISMAKVLRRNPDIYGAANVMAEICFIKGDRYCAIEYYEQSLAVNDRQPEIHNRLGELLEFFVQYDRALEHYSRAHSLDPENTRIIINLSRIYRRLGKNPEADRYYALCREKGMAASVELIKHAETIRKNDPVSAAMVYRDVLKVNPAYTEAYIGLADSYRQTGEYEKAVAALEELKLLNPSYALTYIYLGNIYYNNRLKGNTRKYYINLAIKNLETAISLEPGNPDTYLFLSRIMESLGERAKADELIRKADDLIRSGK